MAICATGSQPSPSGPSASTGTGTSGWSTAGAGSGSRRIDRSPRLSPRSPAEEPTAGLRQFLPGVLDILGRSDHGLVDVRSPAEFSGAISAPPEYQNEGAQRSGHIPGAVNIPWAQAIQEDDTFKPVDQLRELYQSRGVTPDKTIVTYCRIGARRSEEHTSELQ